MAPDERSSPGPDELPPPRAKHFLLQSALAFGFMAGLLLLLYHAGHVLEQHLIVVASLASTSFMVFARPQAVPAKTRNVIGGHASALALGGACCAAAAWGFPGSVPAELALGAFAVGLTTLAMTVADVEHAPAAGTALAMVLHPDDAHVVAATVALGSVCLAVAGRALKPWLRDLT